MEDPTEPIRRLQQAIINADPGSREALEAEHGTDNVWSGDELTRDFIVEGFMAPYCVVTRKRDGIKGSVSFQHRPRFYYDFRAA
jgi:hypothetical protein